jgi:hypothetical protein
VSGIHACKDTLYDYTVCAIFLFFSPCDFCCFSFEVGGKQRIKNRNWVEETSAGLVGD